MADILLSLTVILLSAIVILELGQMMIVNRLKIVQAECGFSNKELAAKAKTSETTISRIRNKWLQADLADDGLLDRLCNALGCQPGDLLVYKVMRDDCT